jgi:hypothetical protein
MVLIANSFDVRASRPWHAGSPSECEAPNCSLRLAQHPRLRNGSHRDRFRGARRITALAYPSKKVQIPLMITETTTPSPRFAGEQPPERQTASVAVLRSPHEAGLPAGVTGVTVARHAVNLLVNTECIP